tara:strand:+ start:118 stop:594 length:477 start_codon:yes stop_codon:yes gene_type:complete
MDYKALYEELKAENEKLTDPLYALYRITKLQEENEKLKRQLSDPYGGNQTCAELLQNYRDEMTIIEKLDEDECLEDISLVAPYIEKLKAEIDKLEEYKRKVECVWVDLYTADKHGSDIGWKGIARATNYDEEQAKKIYVEWYEGDRYTTSEEEEEDES